MKRVIMFIPFLLFYACGPQDGSSGLTGTSEANNPAYMTWTQTIIDSEGDTGHQTSIAIDSNQKIHISYIDYANQKLKYATNSSGTWDTYTIDDGASSGRITILVDSSSNIHISYNGYEAIDGINHSYFKYATNTSGSWVTSHIEEGGYGTIGLDTNKNVHALYWTYKSNTGDLTYYIKHASNSTGTWQSEMLVDGLAYYPRTMALDKNGKSYIAYTDENYPYYYNGIYTGSVALIVLSNATGSWEASMVDSNVLWVSQDMIIDSNGKVHLIYDGSGLHYATNSGGEWAKETVTNIETRDPVTALDQNNKIHISFRTISHYALEYTNNIESAWVRATVDNTTGNTGMYSDIAIDSNNIPHISYYDATYKDLKYATVSY